MRLIYPDRKAWHKSSEELHASSIANKRRLEGWLLIIGLLICDIVMIGFAMRIAFFLRFNLNITIFDQEAFSSPFYYQAIILTYIIPIWIGIFLLRGLYNKQYLLGGTQEYDMLFQGNTLAMFTVITVGFFEPGFVFARGWMLISWLSTILFTTLGRFVYRRLIYMLRTKGLFLSKAIMVGYNDEAKQIAEQLVVKRNSGLQLLGFVDDQMPVTKTLNNSLRYLGNFSALDKIITDNHVEEVILTNSALSREQILSIFEQYGVSKTVKLRMSSGLYEIITTGLQVKEIAWVPLVEVNKVRLTGMDLGLKTLLDYSLTIPLVILMLPIFLVIAVAIKLDSPGPIIYRRRVVGVNGKIFDAFKFRTMHINGDEILNLHPEKKAELQEKHKLKDDPRITRVGKFLRKLSLDEFPQLFNVLRNEMSLVGPRMITPEEISEYNQWGMNLLTVKPGITGKWQVSGRSDVSYQDRVRLDMFYIRNWNIWMDIQLLIQTIPAVLTRRGAY